MILQRSQLVVDCPVCGRPVEMQLRHVGHGVACGHCRGRFIAHTSHDGTLTATKQVGPDALERAERLLRDRGETKASTMAHPHRPDDEWQCGVDTTSQPNNSRTLLVKDTENAEKLRPTVLLVEHRDEVFARIATDMAEFGMRVIRAKSATHALELCRIYVPKMVVANLDLADQSGWVLASKLRYIDRRVGVWIYQPQSSDYDHGMANFLNVDALLDYDGDLLGLSQSVVHLMANHRKPNDVACDIDTSEEPAAA